MCQQVPRQDGHAWEAMPRSGLQPVRDGRLQVMPASSCLGGTTRGVLHSLPGGRTGIEPQEPAAMIHDAPSVPHSLPHSPVRGHWGQPHPLP